MIKKNIPLCTVIAPEAKYFALREINHVFNDPPVFLINSP